MKEGTVFVVVHAEVDYRSPACYGDRLIVETVVSEVTAASFTFSHVIRERESRRVVVEGSARLAATDRKRESEATRQGDGGRNKIVI